MKSNPAHTQSAPDTEHKVRVEEELDDALDSKNDDCLSQSQIDNDDMEAREQDRLLPIANVGRIMKLAVPPAAKISKEAKESVQECVSEFITAADRCLQEKRKTINGEDIIWAMEQLGFEQYSNLMKLYLQRYKEVTKMGLNELRQPTATPSTNDGAQAGNFFSASAGNLLDEK